MNKTQGWTASALFAGAMFFRGGAPAPSSPVSEGLAGTQSAATARAEDAGPWKASCEYWQLSTSGSDVAVAPAAEPHREAIDLEISRHGAHTRLQLVDAARREKKTGCSPTNWGIPTAQAGKGPVLTPRITALIVTVPDPIHSSMSFEFDRYIDVLTEAAAENHFVTSYFWLPWRLPGKTGRAPEGAQGSAPQGSLQGSFPEASVGSREREPGLLIFKGTDAVPELRLPLAAGNTAPDHVLYLFLVAQTPALGINGEQMSRALRYENYLRSQFHAELSVRHPGDGADIIGPNNSGSAASLRAALDHAPFDTGITRISVAGNTSTEKVPALLMGGQGSARRRIEFVSFEDDTDFEEENIKREFPEHSRLAFLVESGTAYGELSAISLTQMRDTSGKGHRKENDPPLVIRFPRELAVLRGAEKDDTAVKQDAVVNPYLHLSLRETGSEDSVSHLSPGLSPISQEAQWMAIVRELKRRHVNVVAISATNILDQLFLAKFLHRDLPDALLVFYGSNDLFFARLSDNSAYVGSVALSAYPLTGLSRSGGSQRLLNFSSGWVEAFHNAVVYTLWDGQFTQRVEGSPNPVAVVPSFAEYRRDERSGQPDRLLPPPLWATAVGRDGYYPLGIVAACASPFSGILPVIEAQGARRNCESATDPKTGLADQFFQSDRRSYPALSWYVVCLVLCVLSVAHVLLLRGASIWSASTRDFAIAHGDQPRRRAMLIHVAVAMLVSMSFVTAFPVLTTLPLLSFSKVTTAVAAVTLLAAVAALVLTMRVTCSGRGELWRQPPGGHAPTFTTYAFFNTVAALATLAVVLLWIWACTEGRVEPHATHVGLFFSLCCLYPASGVCPLIPLLILLFSWHLWAMFQTRRLAFSPNFRPRLPRRLTPRGAVALYVSDDDLNGCSGQMESCLYSNITSLLISRLILERATRWSARRINAILLAVFGFIFVLFVFCMPVRSLDRFLRTESLLTYLDLNPLLHRIHLSGWIAGLHWHRPVTGYEFLVSALAYTLITVALAGCLRVIVIWKSLRKGLLEPLERSPLRFAFNRLTNIAWTTMLRRGGLAEYWRDMARSRESMQQLSHAAALPKETTLSLKLGNDILREHIAALRAHIGSGAAAAVPAPPSPAQPDVLLGNDLPLARNRAELNLMSLIEHDFALFAEVLIARVLEPAWLNNGSRPVEAELPPDEHTKDAVATTDPIALAEEFLALRYLSLIRAVLINLRQILLFVSFSFVLTMVAWNSYPFQPRQWIDWSFTALLFGFGGSTVWIFAQMHRDPILSRITGTEINKLDASFYIRLATFGAVPVLTWVASQFPAIGGSVSRLLQSGVQFAK